jgi:hypothetical protein
MGYEGALKESVLRLESTREKRVEQDIPILTLSEKENLIKNYHPDYRSNVKREIQVGVNKGMLMANEVLINLKRERSPRSNQFE